MLNSEDASAYQSAPGSGQRVVRLENLLASNLDNLTAQ